MKAFEYAWPAKLEDALALLSERWGETEVLAGGTDLVTSMKQEIVGAEAAGEPQGGVQELKGIEIDGGQWRIGAMTTWPRSLEHAEMREALSRGVQAIEAIGSPQIIHMATLGGNLCQRPRCWYFRPGLRPAGPARRRVARFPRATTATTPSSATRARPISSILRAWPGPDRAGGDAEHRRAAGEAGKSR